MSTRYIFFTFRPQINDQQLFEDFITLFLPFVKGHKEYAYSIENDGTLHRHIHAVIQGDYKDKDKFYQKWNKTNGLKDFKSHCKAYTNTDENGFDTKKIADTNEDFLHTLGYTYKEAQDRADHNMNEAVIIEALEYYFAHRRIKAKESKKRDWTIITSKNAHSHMEQFIDDNKIELPDRLLGLKMVQDRYTFSNVSEKQCRLIQDELHVARCHETNEEAQHLAKQNIVIHTNNQGQDGESHMGELHLLQQDYDDLQASYTHLFDEFKKATGLSDVQIFANGLACPVKNHIISKK